MLAATLLCLFARLAEAQVVVSATSSNTGAIAIGWDHTVPPGGQNRYLLFGVSVDWTNRTPTVQSATYGGVALTRLATADSAGASHLEIWGLANPPEGLNLASVRLTANAGLTAGAVSFTGVDQTSSTGPFLFSTGSGMRVTVASLSAAGDRVFSVVAADGDPIALTAEAPHQSHWFVGNGAGGSSPGGGAQTIAWNASSSQNWTLGSLVVKAATTDADGGTTDASPATDASPDSGVDAGTTDAGPDRANDGLPSADLAGSDGGSGSDGGASGADGGGASADSGGSGADGGGSGADGGGSGADGGGAGPDASVSAADAAIGFRDIDVRVGCACDLGGSGPGETPPLWGLGLNPAGLLVAPPRAQTPGGGTTA